MKRFRAIRIVRALLMALVMAVIVVDLLGELGALRPAVQALASRRLANRGLECRIGKGRIGILSGIRLADVVVSDDGEGEERLLHVGEIRIAPSWSALIRGRLEIRETIVSEASVFMPGAESAPSAHPFARIDKACARVAAERLKFAPLRGRLLGLPFNVEGAVKGWKKALPGRGPEHLADWSWAQLDPAAHPALPSSVAFVMDQLRRNMLSSSQPGVEGHFFLPLDELGETVAGLRVSATDVFVGEVALRTLKGRVSLTPARLDLAGVSVFADDSLTALGTMRYDRERRRMSLQGTGTAHWSFVQSLSDNPSLNAFFNNMKDSSPLEMDVVVTPSPISWKQWGGTFSLRCPDAKYHGVRLGSATFEGDFGGGVFRCSNAVLRGGTVQTDSEGGEFAVNVNDRVWSGDVSLTGSISALLSPLSWKGRLPEGLTVGRGAKADRLRIRADRSPWDIEQARITATATAQNVRIGDLPVRVHVSGAALEAMQLTCPITVSRNAPEKADETSRATGTIHCDLRKSTCKADLRGELPLSDAKRALAPWDAPPLLEHIGNTGRADFEVRLDESPFQPQAWQGRTTVQLTDGTVLGTSFEALRLPVNVSREAIQCSEGTIDFGQDNEVAGSFSVRRDNWLLDAELEGTVSGELLRSMVPARADGSPLSRLSAETLQFRTTMSEVPLKTPGWSMRGSVSCKKGHLDGLGFDIVEDASFSVIRPSTPGKPLRAECTFPAVNLGDSGSMRDVHVAVEFGDGMSVKANGNATAKPEIFRSFIVVPRLRRTYESIWTDFHWHQDHLPEVHVKSLHFYGNRAENRWFLRMEADARIDRFRYRAIQARNATLTVVLGLPSEVRLDSIDARTPEGGRTTGSVVFKLRNEGRCRIRAKGAFCPDQVFSSLVEDWSERSPVAFAPEVKAEVSGTIPLDNPKELSLSGTADTPTLDFGPLLFENLAGNWAWKDRCLELDSVEADLFGGRFSGSGNYCFGPGSGTLLFDAKRIRLKPMLAALPSLEVTDQEGALNVTEADLDVYTKGTDKKLALEGAAALELTESNLWKIPIFSQLANLLNVSLVRRIVGIGDITALSADLAFRDSTVEFRDLRTNGTVIALRGMKPGSYNWRTQRLHLVVRGEILKKTVLIPFITAPISWLFEAELRGTRQNPEWRLLNAVKKELFGEESPQ